MNHQLRNLFLASTLCCSTLLSPMSTAGEFKSALGSGIQYGGIAGWQGSYVTGKNKLRFSLGYAGYNWGYDRYLSNKLSMGGQLFANQYVTGGAISINYKPDTFQNSGWVIGLDIYNGVDSLDLTTNFIGDFLFNPEDIDFDAENKRGVSISIGYNF